MQHVLMPPMRTIFTTRPSILILELVILLYLLHSLVVGCFKIMTDLFSEPLSGTNSDLVQFVRWLKIWALQAGKSDADALMMVRLLLDGPALDWYVRSVPIEVMNGWARCNKHF